MTTPDEKWNLQEAAVRGARDIPESQMDRDDAARYALVGRVLAEPLADSLPQDFARHVAAAARIRSQTRRLRTGDVIVIALLIVLGGIFFRFAIAMFSGDTGDGVVSSLAPLLPDGAWMPIGASLFVGVRCAAFLRRLRLR